MLGPPFLSATISCTWIFSAALEPKRETLPRELQSLFEDPTPSDSSLRFEILGMYASRPPPLRFPQPKNNRWSEPATKLQSQISARNKTELQVKLAFVWTQ
jgi:hypothetical protein